MGRLAVEHSRVEERDSPAWVRMASGRMGTAVASTAMAMDTRGSQAGQAAGLGCTLVWVHTLAWVHIRAGQVVVLACIRASVRNQASAVGLESTQALAAGLSLKDGERMISQRVIRQGLGSCRESWKCNFTVCPRSMSPPTERIVQL